MISLFRLREALNILYRYSTTETSVNVHRYTVEVYLPATVQIAAGDQQKLNRIGQYTHDSEFHKFVILI